MSLAVTDPSSGKWAYAWRAIHSAALDRPGRVVALRLLHGKLFVGAFNRHIHRGTPESHLLPHAVCQDQLATLSHVMLGCPVSLAVWQWFAATWSAVAQQPAPPLHADLSLAHDRRGPWQPAAQCDSLWQRQRAPGHHPALGGLLPLTFTARTAHITSAHRCQSDLSSQDSDAVQLDACQLGFSPQSRRAQPLAQGTAAHRALWILPPRGGGPLGCLHVTHGSLAMATQLPLLWVVLCMPSSPSFPLAVR